MVRNVLIAAANGQISRLIEDRILQDESFSDVNLTLFLRNKERLSKLASNPRVTLVEGDLDDLDMVAKATRNQDVVFVGVVDHNDNGHETKNIIEAMKKNNVNRLI